MISETVAIYAGVFSKNPYIKGMERAFALSTLFLSNKANANSTEIPPQFKEMMVQIHQIVVLLVIVHQIVLHQMIVVVITHKNHRHHH